MKKGILMLAAITAMVFTSCKDNAADKVKAENVEEAAVRDAKAEEFPEMSFAEETFDFGTINEGDVVEHTFTFTNTGEAPLVITAAKGSCGCTVPTWTREPIAPGETGEMLVKFNSRGKKNIQNKSVTITANTEKGKEVIRIKANVTPAAAASGTPTKK
ncbi:MAG TPA: DUF1573 domain-containing protein [Flavobacteriaceae bacterium]|nr:DUF1573 domain-containing protein [Flavobacteriaceae bacterium]